MVGVASCGCPGNRADHPGFYSLIPSNLRIPDEEEEAERGGMPFYENIYYPLEPERAQMSPDVLATPWIPRPTTPPRRPAYSHDSRFKFRTRHESVDWRRIGAIDLDRLANELDFVTLQENIMAITFCNLEHEKCPRCHSSLDPVLLKLLRLCQYTIEYLLHTQEYLSTNLQTLEEKVRATLIDTEEIQVKMAKQTQEVKTLKEECKRRKKIISTQQMLISSSAGPYHKCPHCEKAFMTHSYLQSHMTRRHPEGKQNIQPSNNMQYEIDHLKEELRLAKSQLEVEQAAHLEKISQIQENEHKKSIEKNVLKKFDEWKKEEREKFEDELSKVREMFMKELKEVTSKNTSLENELLEIKKESLHRRSGLGVLEECPPSDTEEGTSKCPRDIQSVKEMLDIQEEKWGKRIHQLHEEHEKEKKQLLSKVEKLRLSVNEDQRTANDFYKKRLDELGQKFREQNELIRCQREQIKELSNKPPVAKKYSAPTLMPTLQNVEPKLSAPVTRDLDSEEVPSTSKQQLINALRKNPSLTKELRKVLEQGVVEKLESLGVKPGVRGIPSDHFNRVLDTVETFRDEKEKSIPRFPQIRQKLIKHVNQKVGEQASATSLNVNASSPFITDVFSTFKSSTLGSTSSASLPRQTKSRTSILKSSQEELRNETKYPLPVTSSTPKIKLVSSKETHLTKPSSITTPPFSSDDESDLLDESAQHHTRRDSLKAKSSLNGKVSIGFAAMSSESDGSLLEEMKPQPAQKPAPAKPARATLVKGLSEQLEKEYSTRTADLKHVGGVDVADAFVKRDPVMELKVTDLDDTEFDSSSLEDKPYEVPRSVRPRQTAAPKKELPATYAKNAYSVSKPAKADARDGDTSSTLVSSLVTVSDFSDTSDA
ncbi:cilium assembly protein DZIP1 isoform 2-T2 [Leptodactylus fuscus]|uniref:cilium assembly protein DZIP1 isoform X2 n=1 Tax=Leptodactylus fuscus TaxID=238119 RepID=UPI003F4EA4BB